MKLSRDVMVGQFKAALPEFSEAVDFSEDVNFVFAELGRSIRERVERGALTPIEEGRIFGLLNRLCEHGDDDVQNVVQVNVFEILTDSRSAIEVAKSRLTGEALLLFLQTLKFFGGAPSG